MNQRKLLKYGITKSGTGKVKISAASLNPKQINKIVRGTWKQTIKDSNVFKFVELGEGEIISELFDLSGFNPDLIDGITPVKKITKEQAAKCL